MKRKLSLTLKSLFALFVSLALVLSTAGPASAEVGYAPEKCTGSKYVCDFWSTNDESISATWRFFACYKTKVNVKIQVKKGSSWKNVKGASAKGKKSDESCDAEYPFAVSVEVVEKSKGTKTYRLVETEKKRKPFYANFKVKVTKYEIDSSDSNSGNTSSYNQATYDFIQDMSNQIKQVKQGLSRNDSICDEMYKIGMKGGFGFGSIATEYANGEISESLALAKANARLVAIVSTSPISFGPFSTSLYCFSL